MMSGDGRRRLPARAVILIVSSRSLSEGLFTS